MEQSGKKAAAGFVPVQRCRSPHICLIQSQRHQMPWECQTQSLKRQPAQWKKSKQFQNNRGYTLWKILCRNANGVVKMERTGKIKQSPGWVHCFFFCIDNIQHPSESGDVSGLKYIFFYIFQSLNPIFCHPTHCFKCSFPMNQLVYLAISQHINSSGSYKQHKQYEKCVCIKFWLVPTLLNRCRSC